MAKKQLKVYTLEELCEIEEPYCFENPTNEERLESDISVLFDSAKEWAEEISDEDYSELVKYYSSITLFKKDMVNVPLDVITDYIADNYFVEAKDMLDNLEELEEVLTKFNKVQTTYTSGKELGVLDCSLEILESIKTEEEE